MRDLVTDGPRAGSRDSDPLGIAPRTLTPWTRPRGLGSEPPLSGSADRFRLPFCIPAVTPPVGAYGPERHRTADPSRHGSNCPARGGTGTIQTEKAMPRSLFALGLLTLAALPAVAQPTIGGDPRVNPSSFRVTTFASGLNYPVSMARLSDGSILVATTTPAPNGGNFFGGSGQLVRLVDANNDGVADGPGTVVANLSGAATTVRVIGDKVFAASFEGSTITVSVLNVGASPGDPYTNAGTLKFQYDPIALQGNSSSLAVRLSPTVPGAYELFMSLPAGNHYGVPTGMIGVSGLSSGTLAPGTIQKFTITPNGAGVLASSATQIASGVRVGSGLAFASNGMLLLTDNGFEDLVTGMNVSADALHLVSPDGNSNLGYPNTYSDYQTGARVNPNGLAPLAAFSVKPFGEARGAVEVAQAPSWMQDGLDKGYFVGFHGEYIATGTANAINPLYWVDAATGEFFPFLLGGQAGMGHLDGLLSTSSGLFVADMFTRGRFDAATGAIYMIAPASVVPEPATVVLMASGLALLWAAQRRRRVAE
jgi:PEP-CTERM motif